MNIAKVRDRERQTIEYVSLSQAVDAFILLKNTRIGRGDAPEFHLFYARGECCHAVWHRVVLNELQDLGWLSWNGDYTVFTARYEEEV